MVPAHISLADLQGWYTKAKIGSRYCYFATPDGGGEYEAPADVLAFARAIYEKGDGFLSQVRLGTKYLYMIERCNAKALDTVERFAARAAAPRRRRKAA